MKIFTETTELKTDYDLRYISPPGEMLLFDIETTGLKKETTQIYLIGCGYFNEDGAFEVRQWMTQSASDEREVLECFISFAERFSVLVHFNGDGFDIPYTAYKADYYGFDLDFNRFRSVDIYRYIKPYKKFFGLERMNQTSVERFLKIGRTDVMNGGLLIPYYYEYERTKDPEAERLLLLHNSDDVKGMLQLTAAMAYADMFDGRFTFKESQVFEGNESGAVLILEYLLDNPVPVPVLCEKDGVMVCAEGPLLQINIEIFEGEAKIPLENYQDYFYLPKEDKVIHKDVAVFVDKQFRKKATKKNCFLKKQGRYIRDFGCDSPKDMLIPDNKGKLINGMELAELLSGTDDLMEKTALEVLSFLLAK